MESDNISIQLKRELEGYRGDRIMSQLAVDTAKKKMEEMLLGEMGKDIKAVMNGEVRVDVSPYEKKKFRVKSWFRRLFRKF